MRGFREFNAFSPSFLKRITQQDEPPTAGEADQAGPWHVEEAPAGFAVFRLGESAARGFEPAAVFRRRSLALLAAAVLPGTGRDTAFRLAKEPGPEGFAVEAGIGGQVVGHSALFNEDLIAALQMAASVACAPESLANLLEGCGPLALERAGTILADRSFEED